MTRIALLCWIAAVAATAFAAFQVSEDTKQLEARAAKAKGQIVAKLEAIHVLEAEWSRLNQPARIAGLAKRHLGMVPLRAEQMVRIEELGLPPGDDALGLVSLRPNAEAWQ